MINFQVLTSREASAVLRQPDDYSRNLNPFSMMGMRVRNANEYLTLAGNSTRDFSITESQDITNYVNQINEVLTNLGLNIDVNISVAKTSGMESMGMPYTRNNTVVITEPFLNPARMPVPQNMPTGLGLMAHEIFHIISQNNPQIRERLYALWGFFRQQLGRVPDQVILNPDAPNCDYSIMVTHLGREVRATPMLLVNGMSMQAMMNADKNLLLENGVVINRNQTDYMQRTSAPSEHSAYHPEEISAEAFKFLIENTPFEKRDEFLALLQELFN